jgi:hypothetical protein
MVEYFESVADVYPDFRYKMLSSRLVVAEDDSRALLVELAFCCTRSSSLEEEGGGGRKRNTFIDEVLCINEENLYLETRGMTSQELEKAKLIAAQIARGVEPEHHYQGRSRHRYIIDRCGNVSDMLVTVVRTMLVGGDQC